MAAAGLILINFERLTRRHKHALKENHFACSSCKSQVASCKLAVCSRMGQPHLKHCQSVTISISYSYLVSRTSRRSPVAQLFAADTAHTAPGRQDGGRGKMQDGGRGEGAQLSGSAAKLITMMDYNTLFSCHPSCPLPLLPVACEERIVACLTVCHLDMVWPFDQVPIPVTFWPFTPCSLICFGNQARNAAEKLI